MHKLYQTMKEEHGEPVKGTVHGDIPAWVKGSLYRNGPGIYEVGDDKYKHMFDPLAMFHRFHISNKTVTYQSRFLRSETYKTNMAAQRIVIYGFGTVATPDPCKNIFQRFLSYFQPEEKNDNTVVNFFPLRDEIYSATETNYIHRIDPDTLETLGRIDISKFIAVNAATAHPHYDPDGTVHNIGYSFKGKPKICIIKIPPKTNKDVEFPDGQVVSGIECEGKMSANYLHSFAMTENYYVYVEQPLIMNLFKILTAKFRGVPLNSGIEWWPNIPARFRIIDKRTGEEVNPGYRYEADPVMIFHTINAYEEDGQIVMDFCGFKSNKPLEYVYLKDLTSKHCVENWRKFEEPEPRRYVLPLKLDEKTPQNQNLVNIPGITATATLGEGQKVRLVWETLVYQGLEFPQINYPKFNGKKYRYFYGVGWHNTGPHFHTVMKVDVQTKAHVEWKEDNCYPSEPTFVPDPDGRDEDDGVLLSAVNSTEFDEGKGKQAFLLVLDAKTMKERARVTFDDIPRFHKDFHGIFHQR